MTLLLKNISYSYSNKNNQKSQILSNFNMEIKKGEFISIVGRSGTGKSTILRLMTGLLKPEECEIRIVDSEISLKKLCKILWLNKGE